jgi:hypothetical protein
MIIIMIQGVAAIRNRNVKKLCTDAPRRVRAYFENRSAVSGARVRVRVMVKLRFRGRSHRQVRAVAVRG